MAECDACGDDVRRRFRHRRRTEAMTHRRTERVCASCHPDLPDAVAPDDPGGGTADERGGRAIADGGTHRACPVCSGATITDGTSDTCLKCGWTTNR
ncbi:hypothetical protein [Natrinema sp. CGMCC1.2065]|uniref:hypothetical protein n=1 Tax=Natrinema sp. CGMCC1.2065 TaxID=3445767 RepID=UPI003F4A6361